MIDLAGILYGALHQRGIADIPDCDFQALWIGTLPSKPLQILVNAAPGKIVKNVDTGIRRLKKVMDPVRTYKSCPTKYQGRTKRYRLFHLILMLSGVPVESTAVLGKRTGVQATRP